MTRAYPDRPLNGTLRFSPAGRDAPRVTVVEFVPEYFALRAAAMSTDSPAVRIAEIDPEAELLRIYPIKTIPSPGQFLQPKYKRVRCFELKIPEIRTDEDENAFEPMLDNLPRGFTKDFQYGLGFPKEYHAFVDAIEELTQCEIISFDGVGDVTVDGERIRVSLAHFEALRIEFDKIAHRGQVAARRVKQAHAHNALAVAAGATQVDYRRGRHPIVQLLADEAAAMPNLDSEEFEALVELAISQTGSILNERPEAILRLRESVELASLDILLKKFGTLVERRVSEGTWQRFLGWNPLVLHLALGFPMIKIQEQASVGGKRFSGEGEKLADFLVKNSLTDNLAIIEIKKSWSELTTRTYYRNGLYGPSRELSGGVNQLLDQRYNLLRSLAVHKDASRIHDIEQYAIQCCLIIGTTEADVERKKSFELFRGSLHGVAVITEDEILVRLQTLRDLLVDGKEGD